MFRYDFLEITHHERFLKNSLCIKFICIIRMLIADMSAAILRLKVVLQEMLDGLRQLSEHYVANHNAYKMREQLPHNSFYLPDHLSYSMDEATF